MFCPPENNVICKELYEIKITDFTLTNKRKKSCALFKCTFSKGTNLSKVEWVHNTLLEDAHYTARHSQRTKNPVYIFSFYNL